MSAIREISTDSALTEAHAPLFSRPFSMTAPRYFILAALIAVTGSFLAPPSPFIVDGAVYLDMAEAMADRGDYHIAEAGLTDDAPTIAKHLTTEQNGRAYPQYPSGYAFIAAPFYALFGPSGLILINALSAVAAIWLTWRIASQFYDRQIANYAAFIFAFATFFLEYAFSMWPHALTTALSLGAVYAAAITARERDSRRKNFTLFLSGFLIGAAINVRVDAILFAPVLFFWLRLFARPHDRIGPVFLMAGLVPGLLIAAYINLLKFGAFTPLTYGRSEGADSIARYFPLMLGGGAFIAIAWVLNIQALLNRFAPLFMKRRTVCLLTIVALAIAVTLHKQLFNALYGIYVLVFNLQGHNAYLQAGVERNEFGHLLFWGYPKKALIQSAPFAPLILIPLIDFFRRRNVSPFALCALAVGAPLVFYGVNQWHGGGSYNMRYFLGALPFIAILSAAGLARLVSAGSIHRQTVLMLTLSAAGSYFIARELGRMSASLLAPAALYPQWLIAIAAALSVVLFLSNRSTVKLHRLTLATVLFALAYSAFLSFGDLTDNLKARARQNAMAIAIANALPNNALVASTMPVLLINAEREGVAAFYVNEGNLESAAQAIGAFHSAGRCIYFHNSMSAKMLMPLLPSEKIAPTPQWAGGAAYQDNPQMAFYLLDSQRERCDLRKLQG